MILEYKKKKDKKLSEKFLKNRIASLLEQSKIIASEYEYNCVEKLFNNYKPIKRSELKDDINNLFIINQDYQLKSKLEIKDEIDEVITKYKQQENNSDNKKINEKDSNYYEYKLPFIEELIFVVEREDKLITTIKDILNNFELFIDFEIKEEKFLINRYFYFSIFGNIIEDEDKKITLPIIIKGTMIGLNGLALNCMDSIKMLSYHKRRNTLRRSLQGDEKYLEGPLCFVVRIARLKCDNENNHDFPGLWIG